MKKVRLITILLCLYVLSAFSLNVFANGGGEGHDPGGGSCGAYWDTCFGMAWQKYKVVKDLPSGGVHFHYTDNTDPDGPVQIKGCTEGQYVYNLGFSTHSPLEEGYQVSTQRDKSFKEAQAPKAKGAYNGSKNTTNGYLEVVGYESNEDVKKAFLDMKEYIKNNPDTPFSGDKDISWADVGYFCFTPPEDRESDYFSSSKVTVNGSTVAETGIEIEQTTKESDDVYVRTDQTTIGFTHNIYADHKSENANWEVKKEFKKDDKSVSFTGGSGGETSGTANITNSFSGHDKAKFISETSPQYSDTYKKALDLVATYKLCESIAVNDTSSFLTKVCANIKVPYNFRNTASISLNSENIYAGEATNISLNGKVKVNKRKNDTTNGTYATRVNEAKLIVVSFLSNSDDGSLGASESASDDICGAIDRDCDNIVTKTGLSFNSGGNVDGEEIALSSLLGNATTANVYDAPAGSYYCVAVAVYPASSGNDKMMDASGSDSWYISAPSCSKIAKKPTLQVWGSGMYTSGNVATPYAVKHIVDGELNDDPFSATAKDNIIFSSWVEQNIVANGLVSMASGAATGSAGNFNNTNNRTYNGLSGSYYGSDSGDAFCVVSPLTMPNNKCSSGAKPGGNSNSMNPSEEKEALLSAFTDEDSETGNYEVHSGVCSLGNINPDTLFSEKKTHVYKCNNNFAITGDIVALDTDGTYSSLEEIPKIIIYAKKNIYIDCSVGRVDAVIIAEENVRTCANASGSSPSVNSKDRSKQLVINGTVITNKLYAQRTYGASTGANSGVPAEIINYDTSLYLWGAPRADATGSGKLESVYQTELAPRY